MHVAPPELTPDALAATKARRAKTYQVLTISFYREDLERLDALVAALKQRGVHRVSRSALLREAVNQLDLNRVPRRL